MLIAFQVILLIIIIGNGTSVTSEKDDNLQTNMVLTTIASIGVFLVTVVWL